MIEIVKYGEKELLKNMVELFKQIHHWNNAVIVIMHKQGIIKAPKN